MQLWTSLLLLSSRKIEQEQDKKKNPENYITLLFEFLNAVRIDNTTVFVFVHVNVFVYSVAYFQLLEQRFQVCAGAQQQATGVLDPAFDQAQLLLHLLSLPELLVHLSPAGSHPQQEAEQNRQQS